MLKGFAGAANHVFGDRNFATGVINQGGTVEILGMIGRVLWLGLHGWLLQLTAAGLSSVCSPGIGDKRIVVSGYDPLMKGGQKAC
jgi:hypothetical protein